MAKISERSLNVKEQDTAKVVCLAWGWPAPTVQWFKGLENESIVEISKSPHHDGDDADDEMSIRVYASIHQKRLQLATTSSSSSSSSPPSSSSSSSTTYPDRQNVSTEFPLGSNYLSTPAADDLNLQPRPVHSTLVIQDARMSDRDVYICEASAFVNGSKTLKSRAAILVRVKGLFWSFVCFEQKFTFK